MDEYNENIDAFVKDQLNDTDRAILEEVLGNNKEIRKEVEFRESLTQVLKWKKQIQEAHQNMLENQLPLDIDNYVKSKMSSSDLQQFDLLLSHDKDLQKEVVFRQDMMTVLQMRKQIATAQQYTQTKRSATPLKTATTSTGRQIMPLRRIFAYAASFLVLLIAGSVGYADRSYSNEALRNLKEEKLAIQTSSFKSGNSNSSKDVFKNGLVAIEKKDWVTAQTFFQQYDSSSSYFESAQLYLAYIAFRDKEYDRAITAATIAKQTSNEERRMKAEWLLIQSQLASDKIDATFYELLDKLTKEKGHPFRKEAQQLKSHLVSRWRMFIF